MAKSYRSTLTAMLREASAACRQALQSGASIDEVTAMRGEFAPARRQVLLGAASAAAAVMIPRRSLAIGQPRVVIVGAGMAGLSCAYRLWNTRGISSAIYEWNDAHRRAHPDACATISPTAKPPSSTADLFPRNTRRRCGWRDDFGLDLENTFADPKGVKDTYWFAAPATRKRN